MKNKSPAGFSLCLNCPPGTFKETAGTHYCQNCINDTHDTTSGTISQFNCTSTQNSTDQYNSMSSTCDKQYYNANGTCELCPLGGLCQNDYSCAFGYPNYTCTDGSQPKGCWTYSGKSYVLINCPSGWILSIKPKKYINIVNMQNMKQNRKNSETCKNGLSKTQN